MELRIDGMDPDRARLRTDGVESRCRKSKAETVEANRAGPWTNSTDPSARKSMIKSEKSSRQELCDGIEEPL